jgi:hypothetical protein
MRETGSASDTSQIGVLGPVASWGASTSDGESVLATVDFSVMDGFFWSRADWPLGLASDDQALS